MYFSRFTSSVAITYAYLVDTTPSVRVTFFSVYVFFSYGTLVIALSALIYTPARALSCVVEAVSSVNLLIP